MTDGPVVVHIKGGLLEVSTSHAPETLEARDDEMTHTGFRGGLLA
jgi:hypothetical protein